MSWTYPIEYKGLEVQVDSGSPFTEIHSEVVGFYIRDEQTIKAIRSRDERIFDFLNLMIDEIEELSLARWASDWVAIEHWRNEKSLDEYEHDLFTILESQYADEATKNTVKKELEWVNDSKQKHAEKKVKKFHSQRRRSDFSKNYDRFMLALIQRDGYKCAICGTIENLSIDHIIPLSKGGSDEIENLRILCRTHNSEKGDKIIES
jgi:5-methylcytosine-specific restriction endonuclease McrA